MMQVKNSESATSTQVWIMMLVKPSCSKGLVLGAVAFVVLLVIKNASWFFFLRNTNPIILRVELSSIIDESCLVSENFGKKNWRKEILGKKKGNKN